MVISYQIKLRTSSPKLPATWLGVQGPLAKPSRQLQLRVTWFWPGIRACCCYYYRFALFPEIRGEETDLKKTVMRAGVRMSGICKRNASVVITFLRCVRNLVYVRSCAGLATFPDQTTPPSTFIFSLPSLRSPIKNLSATSSIARVVCCPLSLSSSSTCLPASTSDAR